MEEFIYQAGQEPITEESIEARGAKAELQSELDMENYQEQQMDL